ncbi:MAG: fasciclin domain-containing protein [Planctomycetaceae bacterium]|nr:fasciclin domain-containing protein [Planctomycetaceae bacterium]
MLIRSSALALLAAVSLSLGNGAIAAEPAGKDIVTTAVEAGSFKTLAAALKAAGLVETLKGKRTFTVFAPTDEAFSKLPEGTVETLLKPENKKQLIAVLTYHVVAGKVLAADVVKLDAAPTVNGQRVNIKVDEGKVQVDGANVVKVDIQCSNGVIHVIDQVILPSADNIPQTADKAAIFTTLLAAAKAAGLVEALSGDKPLTVFAPTDDAFAALPEGTVETLLKPENKEKLAGILKYHVVAGRFFSSDLLSGKEVTTLQGGKLSVAMKDGKAKVLNAGLVKTDIDASNGVVHVIDTVLLPPAAPAKGAAVNHQPATTVAHVCPTTGRVMYYEVRTARRR